MDRRQLLIGGGAVALVGAGATTATLRHMGSMEDYAVAVAVMRAALSERPEIRDILRYATLVPNGHNTQPWLFRIGEQQIDILPDFSRRTPVVDPDDHHLFVSLGCVAETLSLVAGSCGLPGDVSFDPAGDGSVSFAFQDAPPASSSLFEAIPRRQSTRTEYDAKQVSPDDLRQLTAAAAIPGVDLILITDRPTIDKARDLVVAGNNAQMADADFVPWLRFNPRQALQTGDGLFSAASGAPTLPTWLGPPMFDLAFRASAQNDTYARQLRSSSGLAVFVGQQADRDHWVRVGRACQRFSLKATGLGLKLAFINQPVEVPSLRSELAELVGIRGSRPDLLMRFGYAAAMPFSARRPVSALIP